MMSLIKEATVAGTAACVVASCVMHRGNRVNDDWVIILLMLSHQGICTLHRCGDAVHTVVQLCTTVS